jgi:hypothetical protein
MNQVKCQMDHPYLHPQMNAARKLAWWIQAASLDQQSTVHSVEKVHNLAPRFA